MSPRSSSTSARKRVGRKRQPPLAQGPALQFVVASHPDQFRNQNTMRHVRSHVMYKHRGEQRSDTPSESTRSRPSSMSPTTASSDCALDDSVDFPSIPRRRSSAWDGALHQFMSQSPSIDPIRNLAARTIAATTAESARSAPPTFEDDHEYPFPSTPTTPTIESLDDLRELFFHGSNALLSQNRSACESMKLLCNYRMPFLSHVSVVCVYQDVADGRLVDTPLTTYAKTKLVSMLRSMLTQSGTQGNDITIISILHLLVSEIGGHNEDVFDVHQEALVGIVQQRGGIANLGTEYNIATFLIVILLTCTILRGRPEPSMLQGFTPHLSNVGATSPLPISPLYAPGGDLSGLYGYCSLETFEIIQDMQQLTHMFFSRWSYPALEDPTTESRLEQIYTRLLYRPCTEDDPEPDWTYESVRIAALIYCRSIVQGMPLAQSASIMHARSSGSGAGTTVLAALHHAVEQTDRVGHWGDMCGVLLWVYLVGGAASWPCSQSTYGHMSDVHPPMPWIRKCFTLSAVRCALSIDFEHADVIVESQRTMLRVQHMISLGSGTSH